MTTPAAQHTVDAAGADRAHAKHRTRNGRSLARPGSTRSDLLTIIRTMETLPLADVKARLSELIARVQQQHDQVTVTRNGRPAAVVVSIDEWESLQETLEILSDPAAVAAIVEARDAVSRGEVFTTEDILTDLAARRAQSA
jgi:antitoxin YefM